MTFPTDTTGRRVGIDTAGDMSGAAYNTDGSAKIEWATILNDVYDSGTGTLKTSSGGAFKTTRAVVTYNGGAAQAVATLPAGSVLYDVITVCTIAFTATAPSIDIGYAGSTNVILPTASVTKTLNAISGEDESTRGTDLYSTHARRKYYAASTDVIATVAGGSGNAGSLTVILFYMDTA